MSILHRPPRLAALALLLAGGACGERERAPARDGAASVAPVPAAGSSASAPATAAATALPPPPLAPDRGEHTGRVRWGARLGDVLADNGRSIAVDRAGNVAVAGYLRDPAAKPEIDDDGKPIPPGSDGFVALYDARGAHRWTRVFGGRADDVIAAVAFDPDGNVVVGGTFSYEIAMTDGRLTSRGADDGFVVKLAPDGRRLWAKRFGGLDVDGINGLVADPSGDVYATGDFAQEAGFGELTLKSAGRADAFVVRLAPDGAVRWAQRFGGPEGDFGRTIAVGAQGPVLLAEVAGPVDLGRGPVDGAGNRDVAVVALEPTGTPRWATRFGGSNDDLGLGLTIDPVGSVALTGSFDGALQFGGETIRSAGLSDAFVAKLSPAGGPLWIRAFGSKDEDIGAGVAADAVGNLYAVGWFWYQIDFGKGPLVSAGRKDAYALALAPDGRTLWARHFGSTENDFLRSVALGPDGEPAAVGTFHRSVDFGGVALTATAAEGASLPLGDVAVVALTR